MSAPTLPILGQFQRMHVGPIETNTLFVSLVAAQEYASTNPTAYAGQIVKVVTSNPSEPIGVYLIEKNGTLRFIGSEGVSLEENIVSTVDIGGIRVGDIIPMGTLLTEVWQRLLDPDTHPGISLFTATPTPFGLKEVGQTISSVNLSGTIVKGTHDIRLARLIRLPDTLLTENVSIPNGGTVSITDSVGVDNGIREYRCYVEDTTGLTAFTDMRFEFVWPVYVGSINGTTITTPELQLLQKKVVKKSDLAHSYTHANQRMCGCFPVSWGLPSAIKDGNGLSMKQMMRQSNLTFTSGPYSQQYTVFIFDVANTATDYKLTFTFEE